MKSDRGKSKDIFEKLTALGKDALKPSAYYRTAHPELFSDSRKSKKTVVTKAFLEFHLDQLTANKKEQEFEEFCRRLAEKEICSNLVPQPVMKFLRERMRHFDLDIPHPPMFGKPPNGWSQI